MDWWNFKDLEFLIFFIIIVSIVFFLFVFILSYSLSRKSDKLYIQKIKSESNTTRIFIIDVKNNLVTFFNRSDMKTKKTQNLVEFYHHFHPNDVEKVKDWILTVCMDPKKAEQYLEADVVLNKGKKSCYSLLKLIKYNPAVGQVHLESHLLKFITPINSSNKKKKRGAVYGVVKRSVMQQMVAHNRSLRGFTFAIRFYYIRQKVLSNDKIERYMIMTLKNEIYPFCNTNSKAPRQIVDISNNELLLFDLHISSRDEAMLLATSIEHSLKKCIGVNGFGESVNFSIGVVENAQYYQDFDMIVLKAQETCINAQQNNQTVVMYQKSAGQFIELNKYNEEIETLMHPGNMRYLFRPIVDVQKKRTIGYFSYVKGYNTPFSTFSEMSKYAAKVGKNRELFAIICRYIIPKFEAERKMESTRLFLSASLVDLDHIHEILSQIPQPKEMHIVLVFDEQEINENSNQLELLSSGLHSLRAQRYELALLMKDKNLLLDPGLYTNFDYFVAGAAMIGEIRKNNRIRLSIHSLIESLLKYKRPIIATDLEGWQSVELIIKSGISLVSSDTISPSNDMLLPVEKKKMEKLIAMDDSFH